MNETMKAPLVRCKDMSKSYPMGPSELQVLFDVNMDIKKGDFIAIMGPSGSGKSTLMNLVGLLDVPTSGDVLIEGKNVSSLNDSEISRLRGEKIGFVFQTFNLISRMTAIKNAELPTIYRGMGRKERRERAKRLLEQVGLGDRLEHNPTELSGGERQRVALARALVNDPSLILADEPTGNLDRKSGESVMEIFKELNEDGKSIVVVTHNPEIARYAQRIINIRDGRIKGD